MTYFNCGDTEAFQLKVKDQLLTDYAEAQEEYNQAILVEAEAKKKYKRRKFLKENPKEVKTKEDRTLVQRETSQYHTDWRTLVDKRKAAKKESDEAYKSLEAHKDEEAKGFVRENDIQKVGSQYKASWTHLPG